MERWFRNRRRQCWPAAYSLEKRVRDNGDRIHLQCSSVADQIILQEAPADLDKIHVDISQTKLPDTFRTLHAYLDSSRYTEHESVHRAFPVCIEGIDKMVRYSVGGWPRGVTTGISKQRVLNLLLQTRQFLVVPVK